MARAAPIGSVIGRLLTVTSAVRAAFLNPLFQSVEDAPVVVG
jgi:hypothetical protein